VRPCSLSRHSYVRIYNRGRR